MLSVFFCAGVSVHAQTAKTTPKLSYKKNDVAIFAGGCFWCMEPPFDDYLGKGVIQTTVGFSGGTVKNPDYAMVASGKTDHVESIEVVFDPEKISYKKLLEIFYHNINPTDAGGQFADRGAHYRPVVFYNSPAQKKAAQEFKSSLEDSKKFQSPIVVDLKPATEFYPAEQHHQEYYKKNPSRYYMYSTFSGRKGFLQEHWGK
ncbi:MAG: peptide-methionine (S)-S-oxide reductase MsrA [Bdellovibrionota bacterium]